MNLIGNALKFTERGSIRLHVSCMRGQAVGRGGTRKELRLFFAVADTGVGISEANLAKLFKPFSQVDDSAERRRLGTGLGLTISKRLCELLGGTISVDSIPGEGTTFRFSLLADYEVGETNAPLPVKALPLAVAQASPS